jgi:protein-disulfide isomerase
MLLILCHVRRAMRQLPIWCVATGIVAASVSLHAQSKSKQDEILNELRQIRQLLEKLTTAPTVAQAPAPQPAPAVKLAELGGNVIGKADAPLTMIEFTDMQCPYCRQFHLTTFDQLKKNYIDTGKLRYVSRDFPLDAIHPQAQAAAKAVRCAGEQGRFWDLRHQVLLNNAQLNPAMVSTLAEDLRLDMPAFRGCVDQPARFDVDIKKDVTDGTSIGVSGTPSFVIGRSTPNGVDGVLLVGALPYTVFEARFKELLQK